MKFVAGPQRPLLKKTPKPGLFGTTKRPRPLMFQQRDLRIVKNLCYVPRYQEPCRFPDADDDQTDQEEGVRFLEDVYTVEIPNRHAYSEEEKEAIWSRSRDIRSNAQRNLAEFAYEDHDAQRAVELEDFVRIEGDLVHPAHVDLTESNVLDPDSVTEFDDLNF